jgi:hypothetical protein
LPDQIDPTMNTHASLPGRRHFLSAAATLTAGLFAPRLAPAEAAPKPNSVFDGVRIGCITYSYRSAVTTAEETLQALLRNGLSEVELMGGPIQTFAGIPGGRREKNAPPPPIPTDAERDAQLAKCVELRKLYNEAGVNIHIHKTAFGPSDEEIDFNFRIAKALGAMGITLERNE